MKKLLAAAFFLAACTSSLHAQFYYRDIISNNQLLKEMSRLKENKVRSIKIKTFEDDGVESDGFFCEKKISRDYKTTELFTRSNVSGASLFTSSFDDKGQILRTNDSSDISSSTNSYYYDAQNRIQRIVSSVRSSDDDFTNEIQEEHIYYYTEKNFPEKMIRVKNRYDSTVILFSLDDKGNLGIEKDSKSGSKYYYYYDEKNRLTDIVHSNEFKPQLVPDYVFEYNSAGDISQMTANEEGGSNYYVWKYVYENGLRSKERCFSKERKLLGSVEYEYK